LSCHVLSLFTKCLKECVENSLHLCALIYRGLAPGCLASGWGGHVNFRVFRKPICLQLRVLVSSISRITSSKAHPRSFSASSSSLRSPLLLPLIGQDIRSLFLGTVYLLCLHSQRPSGQLPAFSQSAHPSQRYFVPRTYGLCFQSPQKDMPRSAGQVRKR